MRNGEKGIWGVKMGTLRRKRKWARNVPKSRRRGSLGSVMESHTAIKSMLASFLTFQFLCNSRSSHGNFFASRNNFSSSDIFLTRTREETRRFYLRQSTNAKCRSARESLPLLPSSFILFSSFLCRVPAIDGERTIHNWEKWLGGSVPFLFSFSIFLFWEDKYGILSFSLKFKMECDSLLSHNFSFSSYFIRYN